MDFTSISKRLSTVAAQVAFAQTNAIFNRDECVRLLLQIVDELKEDPMPTMADVVRLERPWRV